MDKRNHSQSPAQARKRYASATPISSFTSSQDTIASDSKSDTEEKASTLGPSEQPSRMKSSSFDSGFTSSQLANDTDSSLSPDHSHQRRSELLEEVSIHTPPAVATFAGMVTKGSLTPSIDHETSNNGTMVHTPTVQLHQLGLHTHRSLHMPQMVSNTLRLHRWVMMHQKTSFPILRPAMSSSRQNWSLHRNNGDCIVMYLRGSHHGSPELYQAWLLPR